MTETCGEVRRWIVNDGVVGYTVARTCRRAGHGVSIVQSDVNPVAGLRVTNKLRLVECVVQLNAELQIDLLTNPEVLVYREVGIGDTRPVAIAD